jgi:Ca2+-binding RTX toxin-like protein
MPVHFLNGTVSGPQNLAGPDSLLVDPLAEVNGGASAALTLTSGPWTITVKGNVHSSGDEAIVLQDAGAFVSTMTIGKDATIATTALNRAAIATLHATNIKNAGHITSINGIAGIDEIGNGDFRIENVKGGSIQGTTGIFIEALGTHAVINAGKIDAPTAISSLAGVEKVKNSGSLLGDVNLGAGNDSFTNFIKINHIVKSGKVTGEISGEAGNDVLKGGSLKDVLVGGLDKDTLTGGGALDKFVFNSAVESAVGANRDVITDFNHLQHDKIDLHSIDADTGTGLDQAFHFIGGKGFHGVAGELRYAGHLLRGDVDGNGTADFEIHVNAAHLVKGDFIL